MVTNRGCKRLRDLEKSAGALIIRKDDINFYPDGEHRFDMDTLIWASVYNNKSQQYTDGSFTNCIICEKLSDLVNSQKIVFVDPSVLEPETPENIKMALFSGSKIIISEIRPASEYPQNYTGWALTKPTYVIDFDVECVYITDPSALVYYINGQPAGETSPAPALDPIGPVLG